MEPNASHGARRHRLAALFMILAAAMIAAGCEVSFGGGLSLDGDVCEIGEGDAAVAITRDEVDDAAAALQDLFEYGYEAEDPDDVEWTGTDLELDAFESGGLVLLAGIEQLRQTAADEDIELSEDDVVERLGKLFSEDLGEEIDGEKLLDDIEETTGADADIVILFPTRAYLLEDLGEEALDGETDEGKIFEHVAEEGPKTACADGAVFDADDGLDDLELDGEPVNLTASIGAALEESIGVTEDEMAEDGGASEEDASATDGVVLDDLETYDEVVSQDLQAAGNVLVGFQKTAADLDAETIDLAAASDQYAMHGESMQQVADTLGSYSLPNDDGVSQAHADLAAAVSEWAAGISAISRMKPGMDQADIGPIQTEVDEHMNQATELLGSWGDALDAEDSYDFPKIQGVLDELEGSF